MIAPAAIDQSNRCQAIAVLFAHMDSGNAHLSNKEVCVFKRGEGLVLGLLEYLNDDNSGLGGRAFPVALKIK